VDRIERIEIITRCASSLTGRGWRDIDFLLGQFDLPTSNSWGDTSPEREFNYVREMLSSSHARDNDLLALDDYLHGPRTHRPDQEPWDHNSPLRVFISHLASHRESATRLKSALEWWGIDAFVAHRDIDPGREWVDVILAALHSCDALVGLLHQGFRESDWCDQEVGVALGRAVPILPVRIEVVPYGFFGRVQAIPWPHDNDEPEAALARAVMDILLRDKKSSARAIDALVAGLEGATSFANANAVSRFLVACDAELTDSQLQRLRTAQKDNTQVSGAFDVDRALRTLEQRAGK
jgi:hypothetical protein